MMGTKAGNEGNESGNQVINLIILDGLVLLRVRLLNTYIYIIPQRPLHSQPAAT